MYLVGPNVQSELKKLLSLQHLLHQHLGFCSKLFGLRFQRTMNKYNARMHKNIINERTPLEPITVCEVL